MVTGFSVVVTHSFRQYTAHATARGQGRNGEVKSSGDGELSLRLSSPKSLGGKGDGQNPEQLFAMGVSAAGRLLNMLPPIARIMSTFSTQHASWVLCK